MTVICWDGEVLAVDSLATYGYTVSYTDKLWMYQHGSSYSFVAGCGSSVGVSAMLDWYGKGAVPTDFPIAETETQNSQVIVMGSDGVLLEYCASGYPMECPYQPLTWGSGGEIALGAMSQGANAIEAVKAACVHSAACGGNILYATPSVPEVQVLENLTVDVWGDSL